MASAYNKHVISYNFEIGSALNKLKDPSLWKIMVPGHLTYPLFRSKFRLSNRPPKIGYKCFRQFQVERRFTRLSASGKARQGEGEGEGRARKDPVGGSTDKAAITR